MTAAAIFDLDGTLVSFTFDVRGSREALLKELSSRGFDTEGLGLATPTQVLLDAAHDQVSQGKVPVDFEVVRRDFYQILDGFELASVSLTGVLPGAADALRFLKSRGIRLAVVTNSGRKAATLALARAGLTNLFEFVLTRDETDFMKPRPEGLGKAVLMLGVPPRELYYVGDSVMDIMAAKAAGLRVISVATGLYTEDRLRKEGADIVVSSLRELPVAMGF